MTNEIENYKNTLKYAEKKEVETLMKCNEKYFYITLPYAYMLDIEGIFIEKFGFFVNNKPQWFVSEEEYNVYEMNIIIFNKIEELISG